MPTRGNGSLSLSNCTRAPRRLEAGRLQHAQSHDTFTERQDVVRPAKRERQNRLRKQRPFAQWQDRELHDGRPYLDFRRRSIDDRGPVRSSSGRAAQEAQPLLAMRIREANAPAAAVFPSNCKCLTLLV